MQQLHFVEDSVILRMTLIIAHKSPAIVCGWLQYLNAAETLLADNLSAKAVT